MIKNTCVHFGACGAPLCPEDPQSLKLAAWIPGEEVCIRQCLGLDWLAVQRKIARKSALNRPGFFTVQMLERKPVVTATIKGIEDGRDSAALAQWLEKHPKRREPTEEERQAASDRGRALYHASRGI